MLPVCFVQAWFALRLFWFLYSSLLSSAVFAEVTATISSAVSIPTYYIDPTIDQILGVRSRCFRKRRALDEVIALRDVSATEYFRSHELFAHHFFYELIDNPHRRPSLQDSEFEYIPLLPLHWISASRADECGYKQFIQQILKAQAYIVNRDKGLRIVKPKFTVASGYNMRTALGTGMPTQIRKGEAWTAVSNFVMSLAIGHYERWPQCPDLLRKSWLYVVELPYVAINTNVYAVKNRTLLETQAASFGKRKNTFFFSGNFALYGPEMVCSVRNAVLNISERTDTLVLNTTQVDANQKVEDRIAYALEESVFCLVVKGDSYSTSFFYHAIAAGCIPIVISDWFTFSFPWAIPYEKFVIRVSEDDFLKNTNYVLDNVQATIGSNTELIRDMRKQMLKYMPILSFEKVTYRSEYYDSLMRVDMYNQNASTSTLPVVKPQSSVKFGTIIPFEMMLLELRYSQKPHQYYNNIPCYRPYMCKNDRTVQSSFVNKTDYAFQATKPNKSGLSHYYTSTNNRAAYGYTVQDAGYQVNPLYFAPNVVDLRSHLCRHNTRLIGMYKIVFFMQCVRILWPLRPAQFKPVDNAHRFDNTQPMPKAGWRSGAAIDADGISEVDWRFVRHFHNISRPASWDLTNYPVTEHRLNRIQTLKLFNT